MNIISDNIPEINTKTRSHTAHDTVNYRHVTYYIELLLPGLTMADWSSRDRLSIFSRSDSSSASLPFTRFRSTKRPAARDTLSG